MTPRALPGAIDTSNDDRAFLLSLILGIQVNRRVLPLLFKDLQLLQQRFDLRLQMQVLNLLVSLIHGLHQCHQAGIFSYGGV
ncbi:MAG: hypothetical protein Fur006_57620 [Coleofasciculaceae cyanobacterium]